MAPASRFYKISSSWRHYEEVQLPEGLLVAGDSVCSLNPIYGHGITVAAMEATRLRELLSQRCNSHNSSSSVVTNAAAGGVGTHWLAGLSQEYQQAIIPIIQNAWELSVGESSIMLGPGQQAVCSSKGRLFCLALPCEVSSAAWSSHLSLGFCQCRHHNIEWLRGGAWLMRHCFAALRTSSPAELPSPSSPSCSSTPPPPALLRSPPFPTQVVM